MRKVIFILVCLLGTISVTAQSELPSDSIQRLPANVKKYGDFLIDMGLFATSPVQLPKFEFKLTDRSKDYTQMFSLNPDRMMTQGWGNGFSSTPQYLQMGSFKLKNGIRLNTYGEYNADGYRVPNRSALPWEKNNFKGGFELKSGNGSFGVRIEVQQGRNPGYPY